MLPEGCTTDNLQCVLCNVWQRFDPCIIWWSDRCTPVIRYRQSARSPQPQRGAFYQIRCLILLLCTDALRFAPCCRITKQYTYNSCPNTRDNNYAVPSLGRSNTCSDEISTASSASCNNVISQGASDAFRG